MGVIRRHNMIRIQIQSTDKGLSQLRQEVKGAAQKSNGTADRLSAGKSADCLVYDCLKNRGSQILPGSPFVDQRLNIRFCKYAAPGCNGINHLIMPCVIIQSRCVCLQQSSHLINKRTGAAGTDSVHSLVNSSGKINDLCIFSAQFNGNVCLRRILLKRSGHSNNLLGKGDIQMSGKSQTAGTCDTGTDGHFSQFFFCTRQ